MAYGDNVVANISTYIQTIYEDANTAARDVNFLAGLVRGFNDNSGTAARTRSEYGTVTFNAMDDSDDLSSQTFTPSTDSTLTPAMYGAQFFLTDRRIRSDQNELRREASMELGEGAGKHVQKAIATAFSSLTGGTVGSAGGTVTWANLFASVALLDQQNPNGMKVGVLGNGHWYHLGTAVIPQATVTNAPELQNDVWRRYWVGNWFGVDWYKTNDLVGGTAAVGAVFVRDALGLDIRAPFRVEPERDASRGGGGYELNATMEYATGVWRPKWGVQIVATDVVA